MSERTKYTLTTIGFIGLAIILFLLNINVVGKFIICAGLFVLYIYSLIKITN